MYFKLINYVPAKYWNKTQSDPLNKIDEKVFEQVMKSLDIKFVTQRKIFFHIGNIVSSLSLPEIIDSYKLVESSLMKLSNLSIIIKISNKTIGYRIIEFLKINYQNRWKADITVGEVIYKDFLNQKAISMYSDKIEHFEFSITKNLMLIFLIERLTLYSQENSLKLNFNYLFLSHKLSLGSRNKKENLTLIETALNEIIKYSAGVKSFSRINDVFNVELEPMTPKEIKEFIHFK